MQNSTMDTNINPGLKIFEPPKMESTDKPKFNSTEKSNVHVSTDSGLPVIEKSALHKKFIKLGRERSRISHQLLALLPKIYEQSIFHDYGCGSIYEYAARFGDGLSAGVVDKVLKLKEKLEECPELFETITTQGVHKVAIIANLANKENEKELVDVVENMSKEAVQEYSKVKRGKKTRVVTKVELDEEMEFLFLKLKKKLKTASNKETMKRLLQALSEQFFPEEKSNRVSLVDLLFKSRKKDFVVQAGAKDERKVLSAKNEQVFLEEKVMVKNPIHTKKITRFIPLAKRREVHQKSEGRCAYDGCNRPIDAIHHQDGFSKTKNHTNLIGLCAIHHEFEHNGITRPLAKTDLLYRTHRQIVLNTS